ncbi:hypothetical protein F7Q99_03070 [Streptomyces kaniharaensis]|uniref:Uncharacterized protein n=1 Tax=Streptomyces kaniharaensis TaxID=212423 RepID=A0A5S9A8M4_9ACTN|nr:hypothetical protein [Streptomyces kaniharaensis]AVW82958.1 hypothetical protein [Streptomyces kaniharaensis]MQS11295.1 hypothetical protein [Streptomyces kaniharaensis]QTK22479.1 hypothetical protein [Streptomyces kaniharaensis]
MESHTGTAGICTPEAQWDEGRGEFSVDLLPDADGPGAAVMSFRTVAWVGLGASGAVTSVDVHDIPVQVSDRIPRVEGDDVIGCAVVDTQWLWVPLGTGPTARRHAGRADVEAVVTGAGLARLTLRFLGEAMKKPRRADHG